jgi:UDP-N-acetylglucosamine 2-epimerase (non-hydrolysing)
VDNKGKLSEILDVIIANSHNIPIIFLVHLRTSRMLPDAGSGNTSLFLCSPMDYLEFNYLVENSLGVIADSGGITEETTVLGVPRMTLRDSTKRPETISLGTNELLGTDTKAIKPALEKLFNGSWKKGSIPELWNGNTSKQIVDILLKLSLKKSLHS